MPSFFRLLMKLRFTKAPLPLRTFALCCAILLCALEVSFHFTYLLSTYGIWALILAAHYLLWGILFYRGSRASQWIYWSSIFCGSFLFSTYSDYYFFFSIAAFPLVVAFASTPYNVVNLTIFLYALSDDVHGTSLLNAFFFYLISVSVFFFLPLGVRVHWERSTRAYTAQQELQKHVEEQNLELARELHDGLARHISSLTLQANKALITPDVELKNEILTVMIGQSREALDDLRRMMRVLRKESGKPQGLEARRPSADLNRTFAEALSSLRDDGFVIETRSVDLARVPGGLVPTVQRIVDELAFNTKKYADPKYPVVFSIDMVHSSLIISTKNHAGQSIDKPGTGYGLAGISERINALGGTINTSRQQDYWVFEISLPL